MNILDALKSSVLEEKFIPMAVFSPTEKIPVSRSANEQNTGRKNQTDSAEQQKASWILHTEKLIIHQSPYLPNTGTNIPAPVDQVLALMRMEP